MVAICPHARKGQSDVRFGSKADICSATADVRFTPISDRESGLSQTIMSASPPKADICSALTNVRFGPIADTQLISAADDSLRVSKRRDATRTSPAPRLIAA